MTWPARFVPFGVSLIALPFLLILGLWSAGAGHGNYILLTLLFPFPIITSLLIKPLFQCPEFGDCFPRDAIVLATAVLQFPIYGVLLSVLGKRWIVVGWILVLHLCVFVGFWSYFRTVGFW